MLDSGGGAWGEGLRLAHRKLGAGSVLDAAVTLVEGPGMVSAVSMRLSARTRFAATSDGRSAKRICGAAILLAWRVGVAPASCADSPPTGVARLCTGGWAATGEALAMRGIGGVRGTGMRVLAEVAPTPVARGVDGASILGAGRRGGAQ